MPEDCEFMDVVEGARGVTAAGVKPPGVIAAGVRSGEGDCGADKAAIEGVAEKPVAAE